MRTSNSIKNSLTILIGNMISYIMGFIAQALFIYILNIEYLGLNGLFTNVLSMLSIFELGIGSAIVFNLYKPIAENDKLKIAKLMNFYKKTYNIIALLIFSCGLVILPFITFFVGEVTVDVNIYLIYFLFLVSTSVSYLIVYKRNIIEANQQKYIINIIHSLYLIILNIAQLIILYLTKNYYAYLIVKIVCQLLENIIVTAVANKKYPYLNKYKKEKLDEATSKDIFKRVKALIFHKVGGIVVLGTDNILISKFFGVATVGLYTNYNTIITAVNTIFSQVITSTTASVGNLAVENNSDKMYITFKKMRFLNFYISCFTSVCILLVIQPFITLWIGSDYLINFITVILLVFNYFQSVQRTVYSTFKDAAGIWIEDKFVPLLESLLNIVFSILFIKICGLPGVFIGTLISGLALWCYSYPKFVYKKLFNRMYKNYAIETIGYALLFVLVCSICYIITLIVTVDSVLLQLIINLLICIIVANLLLFLIFRKNENFKYFIDILKNIISKRKKKKHIC